MEVGITTLVSVPAVLAAVNLLRKYGLPAQWAPVVAVLIGAIFGVAGAFVEGTGVDAISTYLMTGIIAGLGASGLYDVAKTVSPTDASPPDDVVEVE